jgi:hypothetical protein
MCWATWPGPTIRLQSNGSAGTQELPKLGVGEEMIQLSIDRLLRSQWLHSLEARMSPQQTTRAL